MDDNEFLTVKAAAEYVHASQRKIWRLVKQGRLTTYRSDINDRIKLVKRSDLDALRTPRKV